MGLRFSLEHANWLAHILQPTGATPILRDQYEEQDLRTFLRSFLKKFYSSRREALRLRQKMSRFNTHQPKMEMDSRINRSSDALQVLREYFREVPWVALLLPSGIHRPSDELLTDSRLLKSLVDIKPEDPGLILQIEDPPKMEIALDSIFPAFKVALAETTRWPGVLLWTPGGDAAFFALSKKAITIRKRLHWLFSNIAEHLGSPDLQILKQKYTLKFTVKPEEDGCVTLLHMSDLHLGSSLARRRMPRVQLLLESVIRELGDDTPVIPVITGDLMDTPSEDNLGDVRTFMGFLKSLGLEKPVIVLGNHDVRDDGWLNPKLEQAINVSRSPVVWHDKYSIGFACFNSVNGGRLARGWIGEDEMTYVANALDDYPDKKHFTLLAALHHHPIPVDLPEWYKRAWYERLLGKLFTKTEELEDSALFLDWLKHRSIQVVLHGHNHIPRFDKHGDTAIVGCGSTVGKVETIVKGQTYMSLNVLTVDRSNRMFSCRLRAERIPGAGLESCQTHELIMRTSLES